MAGLPDQAQHLRQGRSGAGNRLLEALPPASEVLRAFRRLRGLERGIAGETAVGGPRFRLAAASSPTAPPDHRPLPARRRHPHLECSLRKPASHFTPNSSIMLHIDDKES